MADTTGPILATGAITLANQVVLHHQDVNWKIPAATAIACGLFALGERVWPAGVKTLAWVVLATVVLTRTRKDIPSPAESLLTWWNGGESAATAPAPASTGPSTSAIPGPFAKGL